MQVEITEAEAHTEFDTLLSMDSTGDGLVEFDNYCIWAARRQTDSRVKEEEQKDKESLGLSDVMHQYRIMRLRDYAEAQEALERKKLEAKLDVIRNDPVAAARKKYATQLLRRLVPAAKALANDDGEPVFDARQQKVLQGIKRIVFNLRDENHLQVLEVVDELAHDLGVDDDDEIIPPNELPLYMFAEIGAEMVEILADDVSEH